MSSIAQMFCSVLFAIGISHPLFTTLLLTVRVERAAEPIGERNHSDWLCESVHGKVKQKKKGKVPQACQCSIHDITHLVPLLSLFASVTCNFFIRHILS